MEVLQLNGESRDLTYCDEVDVAYGKVEFDRATSTLRLTDAAIEKLEVSCYAKCKPAIELAGKNIVKSDIEINRYLPESFRLSSRALDRWR